MKQFDLVSFLNKFYGINNPSLSNKILLHSDIKKLFPFIKSCPYKSLKKEDIYYGNVIGVYDRKNIIVYYYNPRLEIDYSDICISDEPKEFNINLDKIDNLSKDELLKLRRKCRLLELKKESNNLTRLIHLKKREEPKEYRKRKEKLKLKEKNYD